MKRFVLAGVFMGSALVSVLQARGPVPEFRRSETGLRFADLRTGKGTSPQTGQVCAVLYRGWLYTDNKRGRQFDQCDNRKKPFTFTLGKGEVIKGWDEGIATMKVGSKRALIVPPELAYGHAGAGDAETGIPADATLLFEVELLAIR
jgi:peptidylprolyl isomerase